MLLLFVLALVMGLAVGVMGVFQFWQMALAQTAVESSDNGAASHSASSEAS